MTLLVSLKLLILFLSSLKLSRSLHPAWWLLVTLRWRIANRCWIIRLLLLLLNTSLCDMLLVIQALWLLLLNGRGKLLLWLILLLTSYDLRLLLLLRIWRLLLLRRRRLLLRLLVTIALRSTEETKCMKKEATSNYYLIKPINSEWNLRKEFNRNVII